MLTNEHQLRINFANRLSDLRRASGMTQLELAQKLNYSDKSVSKWERAEGVPDIYVAKHIADIFEVSVDYLLSDKPFRKPIFKRNKLLIALLSMAAPWLLATILNWVLGMSFNNLPLWRLYIYAIPATAVIALIFSCVWGKKIWRFLSVTAIIWSVPTCVFTSFTTRENALVYTVAAVAQVMAILGFLIKIPKKSSEDENT